MTIRNCKQCEKSFIGEGEICNICEMESIKENDDMTKLAGTIEALALLKSMKESSKQI
ncbi:hypothetical protein KQI38_15250 [Tissierella carlieri]|jgi:hypothetical protein|uniref:hypothetical protein n=1 Tax=Tissierella carlieri TaxID=689904 RepID=UPI001C12190A|nr:hypothetical protein [Tissierella carlieri]MBU5313379.1 hypothetical protein [Tissierella carlieri]MDU5082664.1 hypothetical protein [Bacillota bacterium]